MKIVVRKEDVCLIFSHIEVRHERDGGRLERSRGCNGREHIDTFSLVYYDEDGEEIGARYRGMQRVGWCDHSCGDIAVVNPDYTLPGFLYPTPGCGPDYRTHRTHVC